MGFKEKMFETMMGKMSADEKSQMMQTMMDNFFENMSTDEKKGMMNNMMPKMMSGMMDGKGGSMMDMMKNMMGGMMGCKSETTEKNENETGFNPMEMCKKMMSNIGKSTDLATYATPEVRALFEEWAEQIENEILDYIKANDNADPEKIAEKFKLSKESVNFFITKLSQKGKININAKAK
jgi:predicted RNA-binding protein (virulence factor B family)